MTEMCFLKMEKNRFREDGFDIVGNCTKTNTGIDVLGLRGSDLDEILVSFDDFMTIIPKDSFKGFGEEEPAIHSFNLGVGSVVRIDRENGKVMLDRRDEKDHLVTGWKDITEKGVVVIPPGKIFEPTHVKHWYVTKSHGREYIYISPVQVREMVR